MPENGLWLRCTCGASYRALKFYVTENRWYQTDGDLAAFLERHSGYDPEHTVTPVTEDAPRFTWADVDDLRGASTGMLDWRNDLADRIAALLPPRESP